MPSRTAQQDAPALAGDSTTSTEEFQNKLCAAIDQNIAWMHGEERHHDITQVGSDDERVCVYTDAVHVYINGRAEETLAYVLHAYSGYCLRVKWNKHGWAVCLHDRT